MMNAKLRLKILIDVCMSIALLLLMSHDLIGEAIHEWIGMGMFVLVIVHNILNINWYRNLFKGRYNAYRVFQLILDLSIVLSMVGLMVSGIIMSLHVFAFLPINSGMSFARILHMLCAYWGFALMSLHAGLHTSMMMRGKPSKARTGLLRTAAALLFAYGIYAFLQRQIGTYMLLENQFVFFDYSEPLFFFFADYIAIMGMFICAGHYISGAIRKIPAKKPIEKKNKAEEVYHEYSK